jgi:hypothetical protein
MTKINYGIITGLAVQLIVFYLVCFSAQALNTQDRFKSLSR